MKTSRILSLLTVVFVAATVSLQAQLETLGIGEVKATPALLRALENNGKSTSLERLSQALESQLTDSFHATRKFKIVSRADLQSVLKERDLNSSSGDAATVEQFKLAATKYVLITTIDDYEDLNETATFAGAGNSATRRLIRLSAVGKLYETSSGKLVESAPFQTTNSNVAEVRTYTTKDGNLNDELLITSARGMAWKLASRMTDAIYPAKVVSKSDKQLMLNRGDGTDIAVGEVWNAYKVGEEIIDPDTKESLGREEFLVGKVKIVAINPKTSSAEILEDSGIAVGSVLRRP